MICYSNRIIQCSLVIFWDYDIALLCEGYFSIFVGVEKIIMWKNYYVSSIHSFLCLFELLLLFYSILCY